MKKVLSVFLAVLMIFAMISTVAFAASAPAITATANKTTVKVGDVVTVTVKLPANSNLVSLEYSLKYDTAYFQVVSNSAASTGAFGYEAMNTNKSGEVKYIGATSDSITGAAKTLFTVQFKVLKTGGKITCSVGEAYVLSGGKDVNVTSACASASTKTLSFTTGTTTTTDYFTIKTPSTNKISYKNGITLHVNQTKTPPSTAKYQWSADNDNFKMEVSADGKSCTITSAANGDTTITVKLVNGNTVLDTETITMTSKAGFFDKIVAFFRSIFGGIEVLPE
ncbi:MAG: hypothetical protein IKV25_02310 [Clostridia bacterium]|nr:hypothetical protein [Clostridia bacterium]